VIATAVMAKLHPWDLNQDLKEEGLKETAKAYESFVLYLELGRNRTKRKVAEIQGENLANIRRYADINNWEYRTAKYDAWKIRQAAKQAHKEYESKHKTDLMAFREAQQRRAEGLGLVSDLLIEVTTTSLQEMIASGESINAQQLAAVARTAGALAESAMNTGAAALGIDDLIDAIDPENE